MMLFREATVQDIPLIQVVRNSVKENTLSNPSLVTDATVEDNITNRGKGWVCEVDETIVGFAIVDITGNNIWALFLHPNYEQKGIGKKLHHLMLNWYFMQTNKTVWLSTAPLSRASVFYRMQGWKEVGLYGKNEIKFEMDSVTWLQKLTA